MWIKSFLTKRSQYVKIATCFVTSGVPQGSVLGPVLFIVFVNDICDVSDCVTVKLFADDTELYSVIENSVDRDNLQSCLTAIFEWSAHWQLSLSPSKCSVLQVPSVHVSSYCDNHITDVILPNVDSVTDLGVTFDSKLGCVSHIDNIVSKASLRSKLILTCFQSRNPILLAKK